ncbi:MAG: hypothetical protein LBQ23_02335, partial [Puniceicoccales bacterium]|nr:hypothetical protein [Puniceicoccales bacterium]
MNVSKKNAKIFKKSISSWKDDGIIDQPTAKKLENAIHVIPFEWEKIARLLFCFAIGCFIVSAAAFLETEFFLKIITFLIKIFHFQYGRVILSFITMILTYCCALILKYKNPKKVFRNESVLFIGTCATAWFTAECSNVWTNFHIGMVSLACLTYGLIGYFARSTMVWALALLTLGYLMHAIADDGVYYVIVDPRKVLVLGLVMSVAAMYLRNEKFFKIFFPTTLYIGLLYLFISAWILSICGSKTGDDTIFWSIAFTIFTLLAVYVGFKEDSR